MAVGQLLLTYPSRHTWMRPLPNKYLHAAVIAGIGIQIAAASLPFSASLLGNAAIPIELWGVVFAGAFLAWATGRSNIPFGVASSGTRAREAMIFRGVSAFVAFASQIAG